MNIDSINLEFLQSLVVKPAFRRNEFQEEYFKAIDEFAQANQQLLVEQNSNARYQLLLRRMTRMEWPYTHYDRKLCGEQLHMLEGFMRKYKWEERKKLVLKANWRLLVLYGEHVSAINGCPLDIQALFKPRAFKKMIDSPLVSTLTNLAMNTKWEIE